MDTENTNQQTPINETQTPENVSQPVETPSSAVEPPKKGIMSKFKDSGTPLKIIAIGGGVFLIILIALIGILIGVSILRRPISKTVQVTPTPTIAPSTVPIEVLPNPNPKYASDSGFLEIRDSLRNLNQEIGTANFFEPEISPPNIDLNIKIE